MAWGSVKSLEVATGIESPLGGRKLKGEVRCPKTDFYYRPKNYKGKNCPACYSPLDENGLHIKNTKNPEVIESGPNPEFGG